jgi:hypothetical protein
MESRDIVVTRSDPRGLRIIALPDLGWETAPGNQNAAEKPADEELPASADAPSLFAVEESVVQ